MADNYEDYLKQVADLGGVNDKKPLQDFYTLNGALIRFFGMINTQVELWLQNTSLDDDALTTVIATLNQYKATLTQLKFETGQTDLDEYEGSTRTKLEKQVTYIKNEMVLEEAELILNSFKQLKSTSKTEPISDEVPKNDNNFLNVFLRTEYGEGYSYEGKLLNNLPHGNGIINYPNGDIRAIGEWKKGRLENYGKTFYQDGKTWEEGHFENGKLNGLGKLFTYGCHRDANKNWITIVDAIFKNGWVHGQGKKTDEHGNLIYEGGWVNGNYEGQGKSFEIYDNGNGPYSLVREDGNFVKGCLHGQGKRYVDDGYSTHEGVFHMGEFAEGREYWTNGKNIISDGKYRNGKLYKGRYYNLHDDFWYEGEFSWERNVGDYKDYWICEGRGYHRANGTDILNMEGTIRESGGIIGKGVYYNSNGEISKRGSFKCGKTNNQLDGEGECYLSGRLSEKGQFKDDELNGKGVRYQYENEKFVYEEGTFFNGKLQGENGERYATRIISVIIGQGSERLPPKYQFVNRDSVEIEGYSYIKYEFYPLIEEGTFKNGELHGFGKRYDKWSAKLIQQGTFINGVFQEK